MHAFNVGSGGRIVTLSELLFFNSFGPRLLREPVACDVLNAFPTPAMHIFHAVCKIVASQHSLILKFQLLVILREP